ncbi:FUSC family protein [Mesorhizobium sp. YR577]|uniref:FUSC family protein n=1 Tax=Mesorhizobium sp. YR577 TaxID=1884373 RepID=UPI001AECC6FA|nr:FUSC family protein [Mesorhizobium sp. YR577]
MMLTSRSGRKTGVYLKPLVATFFNPTARNIAKRLTLASIIAMLIATVSGLENPWWAAMAVWMIGQPSRGLLLERSLAQFIGTLVGAVAGAFLVIAGGGSPALSLLGLAIWIAACSGVANAMRHQRAYGAALCGLTSAVIVTLTLGTAIDPLEFAAARLLDNIIGIGSAISIAIVFGPPAVRSEITDRARTVTVQALVMIADALAEPGERAFAKEREFLLSLASLEASAEDTAAGSISARRSLHEMNALFAFLLDLIVVARAVRSREVSALTPGCTDLTALRNAFDESAKTLAAAGVLDIQAIHTASHQLEAADPAISPVLDEMRALLARAARGYERVGNAEGKPAPRLSRPHPDVAGLRLAALRAAIVTLIASSVWLAFDWEPLRYLLLGTGIFAVLFSMVDDPAPVVRQVFLGGLGAAAAATLWRVAVLGQVSHTWLSLLLAVPLVFGASLLQVGHGTLFIGLAFNMLFAVLARPVDMSPSSTPEMIANEAMLLTGISLNYVFYRWMLPMDSRRRRRHLRASIRREISAISIRSRTPWAERHLARLRSLVFSLAVLSRGQVQEVEDALAALSLGHVLLRLGEMEANETLPATSRSAIWNALLLMRSPLDEPKQAADALQQYAARLNMYDHLKSSLETRQRSRIGWLFELAAQDIQDHPTIFSSKAD